ncbi:MAG: ferritin family protein [Promethearchaeota archaeon]
MKTSKNELIEKIGDSIEIFEAIDMAIAKEHDVKAFYKSKLEQEKDPSFKNLYEFLMGEEDVHVGFLEDFKALLKSKITATIKEVKGFQEYIENYTERVPTKHFESTTPMMSEISIILAAMRVERAAEDLYTLLAEKRAEEGLKAFFNYMANFERTHYELLDGILEEVTSFRMDT